MAYLLVAVVVSLGVGARGTALAFDRLARNVGQRWTQYRGLGHSVCVDISRLDGEGYRLFTTALEMAEGTAATVVVGLPREVRLPRSWWVRAPGVPLMVAEIRQGEVTEMCGSGRQGS